MSKRGRPGWLVAAWHPQYWGDELLYQEYLRSVEREKQLFYPHLLTPESDRILASTHRETVVEQQQPKQKRTIESRNPITSKVVVTTTTTTTRKKRKRVGSSKEPIQKKKKTVPTKQLERKYMHVIDISSDSTVQSLSEKSNHDDDDDDDDDSSIVEVIQVLSGSVIDKR